MNRRARRDATPLFYSGLVAITAMLVTIDQKKAATQAPQITPNIMTPPTLGYKFLCRGMIVQPGGNANAFLRAVGLGPKLGSGALALGLDGLAHHGHGLAMLRGGHGGLE